jgi:hypothetical protein
MTCVQEGLLPVSSTPSPSSVVRSTGRTSSPYPLGTTAATTSLPVTSLPVGSLKATRAGSPRTWRLAALMRAPLPAALDAKVSGPTGRCGFSSPLPERPVEGPPQGRHPARLHVRQHSRFLGSDGASRLLTLHPNQQLRAESGPPALRGLRSNRATSAESRWQWSPAGERTRLSNDDPDLTTAGFVEDRLLTPHGPVLSTSQDSSIVLLATPVLPWERGRQRCGPVRRGSGQ